MIRVLAYFLVLLGIAYGCMLLVQNPGHITISWFGEVVDAPAALLIAALIVAAIVAWTILSFLFGLPSFIGFAARRRRREKGYAELTRGLVAIGSGDARTATRASVKANRALANDPLAMMLRAQSAYLNGDETETQNAYAQLASRGDTRVLGLRGLYLEASRRGDDEAARQFAAAAHQATPLPWSSQAVLEHHSSTADWEQALRTLEDSVVSKHIDAATAERRRAVLETAIAEQKQASEPDKALDLARAAMKRAPDFAPPVVIATGILGRKGEARKASKLVEKAWPRCPHPDVAHAYLEVRPGDSAGERLARAKVLMGLASNDATSRMTVARAALAAKDFGQARAALAPLTGEGTRPTQRQCTLMAELEEAEFGDHGQWREWLARAARAPLDPAWVADGIVYDQWAPASPTTGRLDAFQWQVPAERTGPVITPLPARERRAPPDALPAKDGPALTYGGAPTPTRSQTPTEASPGQSTISTPNEAPAALSAPTGRPSVRPLPAVSAASGPTQARPSATDADQAPLLAAVAGPMDESATRVQHPAAAAGDEPAYDDDGRLVDAPSTSLGNDPPFPLRAARRAGSTFTSG